MFSHLHVHTEYSLLNGACRVKDLVKKAKAYDMTSLAMTDYGALFGAVEFFSTCEKEGIKPLIGVELFIPSYNEHRLKQFKRGQDAYYQFVLIAQNHTGYLNLSKLVTEAYLEGFYYRPRVDMSLLTEHNEGLICLSGGFNSEANTHLYTGQDDKAKASLERYAQIFKDRFYVELQDNGLAVQQEHNRHLIQMAKELGLPLVATNNVHYITPDDAGAFEVLRGIQLGRITLSPQDTIKFSTEGYYFKSPEDMQAQFDFCPEALANTQRIADLCDFNFTYGKYHLPNYKVPEGVSLDGYMTEEAKQGLEDLWPRIKKASGVTDEDRKTYDDRLTYELGVIHQMGFSGYFLIVSDFIKWAKANGIPVGPGRGSGAGSLVAFCLRITDLDPLPYNLLFERFLNPERVSMPDFDVDFCQDRRGEVIEYVAKKYGNVSQIITFGKMKAKAVIRDVGRVMDLEYEYVDKIAKLIPTALNITLKEALEQEPDLKDLYESDDTVNRLIDTSLRLEGLSRHASVHAAGVIITDKPLWNFVPLYKGSSEDVVVQFDMKSAEKIGLVKFDFLGLKTLTVIHKAVQNVQKTKGLSIAIDEIPLDDVAVFDRLSLGDGCGVFQLESSGMRELMKRLKPSVFEDIIALVALYRPGPMDLIPDFIERKHGRQKVEYLDDRLQPILGPTYGIMVYQEQVMQIAQVIGGYTLGNADLLRRAMGKKIAEEMAKQRDLFVSGAQNNGMDQQSASQLFDMMEKFASYGFNKSHAAAYALVSYQTAWLKTHHVTEYMAAIMSTELEDTDKILQFIGDAKEHEIIFEAPHVNLSEREFAVSGDKTIRYALAALKGVGSAAIDSILEARRSGGDFQSLYDFCTRVDLRRVTKKVIEVLIKSGAMDVFGVARKGLFEALPAIVDSAVRKQKNESMGQSDLFGSFDKESSAPVGLEIKTDDDWSKNEMLAQEKEVFGFYFSGHPLEVYLGSLDKLATHTTADLENVRKEETVILGGTMLSCRVILTKKGEKMAFVQMEDLKGKVEVIVFPKTYKAFGEMLQADQPLIIKGTVDQNDEGAKIIAESLELLEEKLKTTTRSIHLDIALNDLTKDHIDKAIRLIKKYQGQSLVYFHLKQSEDFEATIELPRHLSGMACEPLEYHLNQVFKGPVVRFGS